MRMPRSLVSRRTFVRASAALTAAALGAPGIVGAQRPLTLTLRFRTIPDPDGWHPALRLKGDWLVVELSDGVLSGYGEASHSKERSVPPPIARVTSRFAAVSEDFRRHVVPR